MDIISKRKSYLKLARLRKAYGESEIEKILEQEGDINYAVPVDSVVRYSNSELIGCTALHFACIKKNEKLLDMLLHNGADFTVTNQNDKTPLHVLVDEKSEIVDNSTNSFILSILMAHITRRNFVNPRNKNGLSHFHIACTAGNKSAVQFFADNGASVDEAVNTDSSFIPGYTPLHIAATLTSTNIVETLLAYGADVHMTDAHGKTPLHVLIEQKMKLYSSLANGESQKGNYLSKLQASIEENDKIMNMILENTSTDNDCLDHIGLSNFHVACMLEDTSIAERLADQGIDLNHSVYKDSLLWPGYTALHFAAHFRPSIMEMLIKRGANIELKDSRGLTPFDICIQRFSIEDIRSIMCLNENWKEILFSDGKTKLVSLVGQLPNNYLLQKKFAIKNINMQIPMDSPLWPGCTPLHLAVLFAEGARMSKFRKHAQENALRTIKLCLQKGADVSIQDNRGRTPLHLAFRLGKVSTVDKIFSHCRHIPVNVLDEDNLSHLHIVCASEKKKLKLSKCDLNDPDVNVAYTGESPLNSVWTGSTPLHVFINDPKHREDSNNIFNALLKHGADPNVKDVYGLTPIHWLLNDRHSSFFSSFSTPIASKLLKQVSNDSVVADYEISYLHVACRMANYDAVKRLIENGANVNSTIKYTVQNDNGPLSFLKRYDKHTPLDFCRGDCMRITRDLLIQRGADVLAGKDIVTICTENSYLPSFMSKLQNDVVLQQYTRQEFGWTRLHIACQVAELSQLDEFKGIVQENSADINARIFANSPIWKGCTPLHVLVISLQNSRAKNEELVISMSRILLENGADVTEIDDDGNSPVGTLFLSHLYRIYERVDTAALLMKHHKNFQVNPVNAHGISHFHAACYLNDVEAVKQFLLHGVDVNHAVDCFHDTWPGYTPLQLATHLQVVDLLINHGADVHIEDVSGCPALHNAVSREHFDEDVITKIIESGADINEPNYEGTTPFDMIESLTMEKLTFFMKKGARVTLHRLTTRWFSDECEIACIEQLLKSGQDIDAKDGTGKTALHLAVGCKNVKAVDGLLTSGADINALDSNGHSVLSFAFRASEPRAVAKSTGRCFYDETMKNRLSMHACRLVILKLHLNQINVDLISRAQQSHRERADSRDFREQVANSKEIAIGVRGMRLHDFLSETNAVVKYPSLIELERHQVDKFFESINEDRRVDEIRSFLKLQYRKAVKRSEFIFSAMNSIRSLLEFDLPDLCAECIFQYLPNHDLNNLIRGDEIEEMKMDVD